MFASLVNVVAQLAGVVADGSTPAPSHTPVISQLYIYPIKSCKGIPVTETSLSKYGFENDRIFVVIDPATNMQRTMRELSTMALIKPAFTGPNELSITAGSRTVKIPINIPSESLSTYPKTTANIWGDILDGYDMGDEIASLLTDYLNLPSRLIRKDDNHIRPVLEHSPGIQEIGRIPEAAFSDNFPILCLAEESVQDINQHLEEKISVLNFRPNLIITGTVEPFEEDLYCVVEIGQCGDFYFTCRCTRCSMPNVSPETGIKHKLQPQKTLQSIRRVDKGKKAKFDACVGVNVVPGQVEGVLKIGDSLKIKQVFQGTRARTGALTWSTKEEVGTAA